MVVVRRFLFAVGCFAPLVSSGCGTLPGGFEGDSGIMGMVQAGPTCPAVQPGLDCDDRPVVATIVVRDVNFGFELTRFTSDAEGMFRIALVPGTYLLDPEPDDCCIGEASTHNVVVLAGQFTNVIIVYDTGIR